MWDASICFYLVCRRLLREEFKSGRLDAAPSKAEVLGELCDRLNFDGEAAAQLHKQLYREKLTSVLEDKSISGALPHLCHLQMRWRIATLVRTVALPSTFCTSCSCNAQLHLLRSQF